MDGSEHEVQVRRFVDEVWNGQNYEAATDVYSQEYRNPRPDVRWRYGRSASYSSIRTRW